MAEGINCRPRLWLTLFAILLATQVSGWWYPSRDGSAYLASARGIAWGESGSELSRGIPPGYPLLISPAFWLSERPFWALSVMHWLMAVAFMLGVYRWATRLFPSAAVLIAGVAVINTGFGVFYRRTLKEIAFMALMIWTANVLSSLLKSNSPRRTVSLSMQAGLLLTMLITTRFVGIVIVAGFAVAMFLKAYRNGANRFRAIGLTLVLGATASISLMLLLSAGRMSYLAGFVDPTTTLAAQLFEGLRTRISDVGRVTLPGMFKSYSGPGEWFDVNMLLYVALFAILLMGWWRLVRKELDVWALALPFYFVVYMAWPFDQGARFFVAIVPLLTACAWLGLSRWLTMRHSLLAFVLIAHLGASTGYWLFVDAPRAWTAHRQWTAVDRITTTINTKRLPVAISSVAQDALPLFQLALDRYVRLQYPDRPIPADIHWMVIPKHDHVPAGFSIHEVVGDFKLLSKQPSAESRVVTAAKNSRSKPR